MIYLTNILAKLNRSVAVIEKTLIVIILTVMIAVSFGQVISRNFFESSWPLGDIITRHLLLWICFIGASLTTYNRSHIKIDLLRIIPLPKSIRRWISILADLFAVVVCAIMGIAGLNFVIGEYQSASMLAPWLPRWVFMTVIPVWLWIISVRFAGNFVSGISNKDYTEPEDTAIK